MTVGNSFFYLINLRTLVVTIVFFGLTELSLADSTQVNQTVFDQYIQIAMTGTLDPFIEKDGITCRYVPGIDPTIEKNKTPLSSVGKDQNHATQLLALKCIKFKCDNILNLIKSGVEYLNQFSTPQTSEFLSSQGYSPEQIQTIVDRKKQFHESTLTTLNCLQISPASRMLIVYSCFDAMNCSK